MSCLLLKSDVALRFAKPTDVAFKAVSEGRIEGYASLFDNEPDLQGDVIAIGAYRKSLDEHRKRGTSPAMLWSHRQDEPIGRWTAIVEDAKGLAVAGQLNLKSARGREAWEHIAGGDVDGYSIGFQVPKGGAEYRNGSTLLKEIILHEISVVSVPAKPGARISGIKSLTTKSELVDLLREVGLAKSAAARVAAGGWPALAGADHRKSADLASLIERAAATLKETSR